MKKRLLIVFIFLFGILLTDQAGNTVCARAGIIGAVSATEIVHVVTNATGHSSTEDVGIDTKTLTRIDQIVKDGMRARAFPGCQVLVLKEGKTIYDKCFGNYTYESTHKVKPTTIYDLASLSKPTGTLLAIMKLYDNGSLKLTDKASTYLPFLRGTDKENITITQLLFHESGLPASLPFYRLVLEKKIIPPSLAVSKKHTQQKYK